MVNNMTFNSAREAQDYVSSHPEIAEIARQIPFLDSATVTSRIYSVRYFLKRKGFDIMKPCSRNDEAGCWLLEHLTLCNRVLYSVDVQLHESKPGELNFSPTGSRGDIFSEVAVLDSLFLICWLVKQHPCIQAIDLHGTRLFLHFPTALKLALAHGSNIRSVKVGTPDPTAQHNVFLKGIRPDTMLEHFEARDLKLDMESASRLSEGLKRSPQLKSIVLDHSGLSKKGMKLVLKALQQCNHLTSLHICHYSLKEGAAVHLAEIVKRSMYLKDLFLYHIPDDVLEIIAIALRENGSIENLKINESNDSARSMPHISHALKTNGTIRTLELNDCGMEESDAAVFAQALKVNVTLQRLQLRGSRFRDAGARHLAEALESNQTLRELDISWNHLTEATVVQFVKTLTVNTSLEVVRLGMIDFVDEVDEEIAQVIRGHECCHRICTTWNILTLNELARLISLNYDDVKKIHIFCAEETPILQVISALESNCHITEVHIETADGETAGGQMVKDLAQLIKKTRSLKFIRCTCPFDVDGDFDGEDEDVFATFIKGLTNNDTINRVELESARFTMEVARAFSAMLEANTTLYAFVTQMSYFDAGALKVIARHLTKNYTLRTFCVGSEGYSSRVHCEIFNVLRRNEQLLNRATRFALGTCRDCDCREAFRILWRCDSVVQQVKCVTECTEEDARQCVEAAKLLFL
ncbi:NLR family CARD domain-containing protein 3-like [Ornithodoros turicata]|uniref:NLR family CARD domain-containing protein 3-like n=1 Tax=Ornithodoros turicata TaxID=34597 RepID=UPI00313A10F3